MANERRSHMALRTMAWLVNDAPPYMRGDVLDAGAGSAPYKRVFEHNTDSWTTLDARPVADIQHDFDEPIGRDGEYETVLCTDALQFSRRPQLAVSNLAGCLKTGGHLVLSAPNCYYEDQISRWRFTLGGMGELVEQAGLEIVTLEGLTGLMTMEAEHANMIGEYASAIPASFRGFIGHFDRLYPMITAVIARKP